MAGSFLESWVQIEKEGTYGTAAVAGMTRFPTLSFDVNPAYDIYESQQIVGAAGASAPAFGVKRVTGRWGLEAGYNGLDYFLYGILGGQASTGAGDPFTNTYTASSTLPSFTVQASYGDLLTGTVAQFEGLKFNTLEMAGDAAQGFINVSADVIAQDADHNDTTGVAAAVPTTTLAHEPINITPATTLVTFNIGIGAYSTYCVRAFTIRVERFLTANRICIGSSLIKEPVPAQPMKVSGSFTIEHLDFAPIDALTEQDVHTTTELEWDGGTHTFDMTFPKLVYTGISTPIQSGDVLVSTINWIAYGTGAGEPVQAITLSGIDSDLL
jgi:hypothetical protein